STASSGVLFNTLGAPLASTPTCDPANGNPCPPNMTNSGTTSAPQPAGLVSIQNSATLVANFPATITCPAGHFAPGTAASNGTCRRVSYPELYNDVFWQNRSFYIGVGALGTGTTNQQNLVSLYNAFTTTRAASQSATGACPTASYWDIGVRGDTGPTNHASTVTLTPEASILTNITGYAGGGTGFRANSASNPGVVSQYCNGSRVPPEFGGMGWQVPPGISDATVPNPIFNLTPAATVDEGNNWINISWGPLAMTNPATGATLGNYGLTSTSPAINYITPTNSSTTYTAAPSLDFFNDLRKINNAVDVGAVEFGAPPGGSTFVTGGPLAFGSVPLTTTSAPGTLTLTNSGGATTTGIALAFSSPVFSRPAAGGTCTTTLAAGASCTINVVFSPTALGLVSGTLTITANVPVIGSPVTLTGTGIAAVVAARLAPATWNTTANRGVTLTGPAQLFTLTNIGNVPLAVPTQSVLSGLNAADWTIIRLTSTCGPAGGGQLLGQTTLAAGASCLITAQFRPLTTEPLNSLSATLSVAWAYAPLAQTGTQTSAFTGTATGAGLISISPTSGVRGTTVPVTLTGTNLTVATAVNGGTGVACTITGTTTATTLTANCVIASTATLGAHAVTVSTPTGASNAVTFTVLGATIAFAGPTPALTTITADTTPKNGTITVSNTATGATAGPFTFTANPGITP
ncbi:MAG: choice-of-anchor D domain-containing protein, partial [Deltaproteobacteria bacterium]